MFTAQFLVTIKFTVLVLSTRGLLRRYVDVSVSLKKRRIVKALRFLVVSLTR